MAADRPTPILRGANWFADGDVLLWQVAPEPVSAGQWASAVAGLDRILPPGLPPEGWPAAPDRAEATEFLAAAVCRWAGLPPLPIARSVLARQRRDLAALSPGFPPLTRHALILADALLAPGGPPPGGPRTDLGADRRAALLAIRQDGDGWLRSSRRYLCAAAARRGLPFLVRTPMGGVSQIGEGRHLQLFDATATDRTSFPALQVAGNKRLSNALLRQAGIPVARQRPVPDLAAARRALDELGLPLVVKPEDERRQAGVGFVFRAEDLETVWSASRAVSADLLAESYIPGVEHRVLVADGRVVHAVAGAPASVVGDGRTTVAGLVAAVNAGRDRGARAEGFRLSPIPNDAAAQRHLAAQGLSPEDVPAAGRRVEVHPLPMMRFGAGWKTDVTDRIHPETARMVLRAVAVLGLDVAGVDLRTPDIGRSWREVGAGLCEVNPQPSLTVHYNFAEPPHPGAADRLLEIRFPPGRPFRMHHVAVVVEDGGWAAAERIAADLRREHGWRIAVAAPDRIDLDGWAVPGPGPRPFDRYAAIAADPSLDAAVHVLHPREIERFGLGMRHLDRAYVRAGQRLPPVQAVRARQTLETAGAAIRRLEDGPA